VTAIEAITAYRRAVLVAEQQLREGSRGSIKELAAALVPFANRVTVRVDAKLHPQHTFYGPPAYRVELRALEEERIVPLEMAREPIYPLGTYPAGPGPNTGMVGVRVDATFDWGALMVKDCCDVLVFDELGRQVARQRVLFTSYR
jgi:hypothetical protein